MRTAVTLFATTIGFAFPSLNVLLALIGSVMGTTLTIVLPVLFYNKAYSLTSHDLHQFEDNPNASSDNPSVDLDKEEQPEDDSAVPLIEKSNTPTKQPKDSRKSIKKFNYFVLFVGISMGCVGFYNSMLLLLQPSALN